MLYEIWNNYLKNEKNLKLLGALLVESVDVEEETGVEIRNEIRVGVEEIVLGYAGDLRLRQNCYYLTARHYWVLELRHSSNFSAIRFRTCLYVNLLSETLCDCQRFPAQKSWKEKFSNFPASSWYNGMS